MRKIWFPLQDLPGYEQLPERFRRGIDFANAYYSEMQVGQYVYDPSDPKHQTHETCRLVEEIFSRGFRKGVQNQAQHDEWVLQRNIQPLVNRAKMLSP